jgi:hypothetical protein
MILFGLAASVLEKANAEVSEELHLVQATTVLVSIIFEVILCCLSAVYRFA